jgi:hypothetical protein
MIDAVELQTEGKPELELNLELLKPLICSNISALFNSQNSCDTNFILQVWDEA